MSYKIQKTANCYCKLYNPQTDVNNQIAGFSLMGTIIDAKTHTKKELLSDGWTYKYPSVPTKLVELYSEYNIIIFVNKSGLKTQEELNILINKVDKIVEIIGIPISYCLYTPYTPDHIGIWSNTSESFYCGNNAGRPAGWKYKQIGSEHIHINKLADKSKNDLFFAFNSKVRFILPEAIFCKLNVDSINKDPFEIIPRPCLNFDESIDKLYGMHTIATKIDEYMKTITVPIMILMIGLPASGKTKLTDYIKESGDKFESISKDEISNKRLYDIKLESMINKGKNIIVDNTNVKRVDRLFHSTIARKHGYKIIGITIDTLSDLINHLNIYRSYIGIKALIPKVVYNTMMKHH